MFVTKRVLEEYLSEKNACGWVIYFNQKESVFVSSYTHTSVRVPEPTTETPVLIVRKDYNSVLITDTTTPPRIHSAFSGSDKGKSRQGIPLTEYPSYVDKLYGQLEMLARLVDSGNFEGPFLKTVVDLIYDTGEEVSCAYRSIKYEKEKSHPSSFEICDLVWVDPDIALGITEDFSKEEHLDKLIDEWREGDKVNQLCFILERYLSWHGVKPEESPLTEFVDETIPLEEYSKRLEDTAHLS